MIPTAPYGDFGLRSLSENFFEIRNEIWLEMAKVKFLWSIGIDLIGFSIECRRWNLLSSLSLNWCMFSDFSIVLYDLRFQLSSYDIVELVGVFG